MINKNESMTAYKIRRAKEERERMQKRKTQSIKKITYLLKRGWTLYQKTGSVTAYSNSSTWEYYLSHPKWCDAFYEVPAKTIDKLNSLGIIKYTGNKTAALT